LNRHGGNLEEFAKSIRTWSEHLSEGRYRQSLSGTAYDESSD